MDRRLLPLLERQSGVVARRQALAVGLTAENVERLLRRKELAAIHPGVYVDHTGAPTWDQRAWGAVLWGWPAVLSHSSALAVVEGPGSPHRSSVIEIAVLKDRRLLDRPGVVVRRSAHVAARTQLGAPPRVRYAEAVLDVVARLDRVDDVVAELARVVQVRCTSADRLLSAVRSRRRVRHRDVLVDVLGDVAAGATSALERRYVCDVERPHGLPQAFRQLRHHTRDGVVYRDVLYRVGGRLLVLELDGRGFHQSPRQRDRDIERDLLARVEHGAETTRLGWGQCAGRPCRTAGMVGVLLRRLGWSWPGARLSSGLRGTFLVRPGRRRVAPAPWVVAEQVIRLSSHHPGGLTVGFTGYLVEPRHSWGPWDAKRPRPAGGRGRVRGRRGVGGEGQPMALAAATTSTRPAPLSKDVPPS